MPTLRRSLVINFFSSSGAALVQFLVSILIARMLTPGEIGVFSITAVFVNVAHMFRDFGVATYIQREADLTTEKIRSALGILFTSSWLLAAFLFGVSDWLGSWFKEPGIVPVMRVLALGFVVIPFGSLTHSLLLREFKAEKQAVVTATGTIAYCATSLMLAALGFGTMSLAWANLVNIAACALAYIPLRPKHMPLRPSFRGWARIAHFGVGTLMTNCVEAINGSIADILLGKLANARYVGLFSRANSTVSIFSYIAGSTVTYGAVTYMAQAHGKGESLVPILRRAIGLLTGVGWPAMALTAVFGRDIVVALYGEKWLASVPAILPLSIAGAFFLLFSYTSSAMTAIGRPYLGAIPQVATLIMRVAFGFFLFNGELTSFGWAICFATVAVVPVLLFLHQKYIQFSPYLLLQCVVPSLAVTLVCTLAGKATDMLVPEIAALPRLLLIGPIIVAVWYAALRLLDHSLVDELHHLASGFRQRFAKLIS